MSEKSQFALLRERRFLPFFLTQFFGAANDNVFKFAFTVLATYSAAQWGDMDPKSAGAVIGGIFILPYVQATPELLQAKVLALRGNWR